LMTLESQTGSGSIFHVYLPLTDIAGHAILPSSKTADPVLLLLSKSETPTAAISALSQSQQLGLYNLNPDDDLDGVLKKVYPAGLVWDVANATPEEWAIFERLRAHPELAQLPLIVYGEAGDQPGSSGVTDVLLKPISDKTLMGTLLALYPRTG